MTKKIVSHNKAQRARAQAKLSTTNKNGDEIQVEVSTKIVGTEDFRKNRDRITTRTKIEME